MLIAELLATAPVFKVLATSRERLGISWEHLYMVRALAVPDAKVSVSLPVLRDNPAVALFLQTANRIESHFALSPGNAPATAQICRHLQGVPLAIELVAAHVSDRSPEELACLDGAMVLLTGPRDAPRRHETMGRAIEWSYDLLDEEKKRFFRRLSVFIGGFTLEAAEFVCGHQESSRGSVLERLTSLKNKSLIVRRDSAGQSRFTMLEVIREYAVERPTASQEEEALQRRHAEFFCNLAEHGGSRLQGETLPATLDALEAEIGNLRAALQWSVDSGDAETGLRIAGPLRHFWYMRDHTSEARSWLKSLLSIDAGVTPPVRAKAMAGAAVLKGGALIRQEDYCGALPLLEESLSAYQELGDTWHVAATLNDLCLVAIQSGDYRKSIAFCERSLTLFEELKDKRCIAMAANNMALLLI
jgi:predicted ATPase